MSPDTGLAPASGDAVASLVETLKARFGERVSTAQAMRDSHGRGEGAGPPAAPDAVVFAQTTEEVAEIVALCSQRRVPVIPFGAGSSLEGQLDAVRGGISLDLTGLDKILEVNAEDLDVKVEAGVTREQLNAHLRDQGLFFPLDPGANATLGGMASTRASGTNAVRYGTMREVTLGLTVVTASGEIVTTGGRARKSSAGYDLTRLFVGAEGTLGVITELRLRLFGVPERITSGLCQFDSFTNAVEAVSAVIQMGVPVARIEFLDTLQMQACIAYSKLDELAAKPTLFLEFHGSPASVDDQIEQVREIFDAMGGGAFSWADKEEDRSRLWKARHDAYFAARALAPGTQSIVTDACVPISRLAEAVEAAARDGEKSGFACPIVGHVGDGNFHVMILHDGEDPDAAKRAKALSDRIARRAVEMGGTSTGEHGIGLNKLAVAREELGASAALMRTIKDALDPHSIMNPGKTLPV
ncbi:MAG: FAD-linked oxidase C-terminal domain-containing protein [Oceanicaulis sp.]